MAAIVALLCVSTLYTDLAHRRVPNVLLAAAVAAASLVIVVGHSPAPSVAARFGGACLGVIATLPVYVLGRIAAGDVKFAAVGGLLAGPQALVLAWTVGSLLGMAHALLALVPRDWAKRGWARLAQLLHIGSTQNTTEPQGDASRSPALFSQARGIPYAAYMAVGLLVWLAAGT